MPHEPVDPDAVEHVLRLFREQLNRRDDDPWRYQDDGDEDES